MATDLTKMPTFDGERENYPAYAERREGFKVINKRSIKNYFGVPQPSTRDRVTQAYTVADDAENDPTGARPGTRVTAESVAAYNKKEREWLEDDLLWYYLQFDKYGKTAEDVATSLKTKSGKVLEAGMDTYYMKTTNSHAAHTLRALVKMTKGIDESIEEHTKVWTKNMRQVEANMDFDQIKCCLYLGSLGEQYQNFYDIATSSTQKLELQDLIKRAADHRRGVHNDEANTNGVAMSATTSTKHTRNQPYTNFSGTKPDTNGGRPTCTACGSTYHHYDECFNGGLSHLDRDGRRDWLDMKRRAREMRRGDRNTRGTRREEPSSDRRRRRRSRSRSRDREERTSDKAMAAIKMKVSDLVRSETTRRFNELSETNEAQEELRSQFGLG